MWLSEVEGEAMALMRPAEDHVSAMWAVGRAVKNVWNNAAELLDRIDNPNAPPPSADKPVLASLCHRSRHTLSIRPVVWDSGLSRPA